MPNPFDEIDEISTGDTSSPVEPLKLADLYDDDRLSFDLGNNKIIFFKSTGSISAEETAQLMKAQKLIDGSLKALEKNPSDADAIRRFEKQVTAFVKFILPDMPEDILLKLDYAKKSKILQYWTENSDSKKKTRQANL